MKTFYIAMHHIGTGLRYVQPVAAETLQQAIKKARDFPYNNGDYLISITDEA